MLVETRGVEVQPADLLGLGLEVRVVAVEAVDTLVGLEVRLVEDAQMVARLMVWA